MRTPLKQLSSEAQAIARITRPHVAAQAALYTILGAYLGTGNVISQLPTVIAAALVVAVVVAFGFVINDDFDLELDLLTKPGRPLPAGLLSRADARRLEFGLGGTAMLLAIWLPPPLFWIAAANLALTAAYSLALKRTVLLGNLAMAILNSSVILFGGFAAGTLSALSWIVAAMSFLYTIAQEVIYTVDDIEGDRQAGLVTTAVYLGVARSLQLFRALMVLTMLVVLAPLWIVRPSPLYLAVLLVCTLLPIVLYVLPLARHYQPAKVRQACEAVKIIRLTSLLPLILLRTSL